MSVNPGFIYHFCPFCLNLSFKFLLLLLFQILVAGNLSLKCCYNFLRLQRFCQLNSVDSHFHSSFYKCFVYTLTVLLRTKLVVWSEAQDFKFRNASFFFREERIIHLLNGFFGEEIFSVFKF